MDGIYDFLIGAGAIGLIWFITSVKVNVNFRDIMDYLAKSKEQKRLEKMQRECLHGEPEIFEHEGKTCFHVKHFFESHPQNPQYKICKRCNILLTTSRMQDVLDDHLRTLCQVMKDRGIDTSKMEVVSKSEF